MPVQTVEPDTESIPLRKPRGRDELGIPLGVVHDLVLRRTLFDGRTSTVRLGEQLALSPALLEGIVEDLRELRYIEVLGLEGRDYQLTLTDRRPGAGQRAHALCRYAGPAPVSLRAYSAVVNAQHAAPTSTCGPCARRSPTWSMSDGAARRGRARAASPAGAMFLYGPPGTGKTSDRRAPASASTTTPCSCPTPSRSTARSSRCSTRWSTGPSTEQPAELDPRWVLCRRPCIIVGGELQLSHARPHATRRRSGVYLAPIQMQANNGVLVIDDFGRQTLTPGGAAQPLDRAARPARRLPVAELRRASSRSRSTRRSCSRPTWSPRRLGDEAFFRRIQNKILVPSISRRRVRRGAAPRRPTRTASSSRRTRPTHLRRMSRELGDGDLRPYLPRRGAARSCRSVCQFTTACPLVLDRANVDRVASVYFTRASSMLTTSPAPGADLRESSPPRRAPAATSLFAKPGAATMRSS